MSSPASDHDRLSLEPSPSPVDAGHQKPGPSMPYRRLVPSLLCDHDRRAHQTMLSHHDHLSLKLMLFPLSFCHQTPGFW